MSDFSSSDIPLVKANFSYLQPSFFGLLLAGGFVALPLLTATLLLSARIPIRPALINFCIAWILYSISFNLLNFTGAPLSSPPLTLCYAQSAMVQGAPPLAATLTLQLLLTISETFQDSQNDIRFHSQWCQRAYKVVSNFALPYVVYSIFVFVTAGVQQRNPDSLTWRVGLYCAVSGLPSIRWAIGAYSMFIAILLIAFQINTALYYHNSGKRIFDSCPLAELVARIVMFNIYACAAILCGVALIPIRLNIYNHVWFYMLQATMPLIVFLVLASQKDVVQSWCFWTSKPKDDNAKTRPEIGLSPDGMAADTEFKESSPCTSLGKLPTVV